MSSISSSLFERAIFLQPDGHLLFCRDFLLHLAGSSVFFFILAAELSWRSWSPVCPLQPDGTRIRFQTFAHDTNGTRMLGPQADHLCILRHTSDGLFREKLVGGQGLVCREGRASRPSIKLRRPALPLQVATLAAGHYGSGLTSVTTWHWRYFSYFILVFGTRASH